MSAPDLAWLLDLEEIDTDLYRGPVEPTDTPRFRLYGGLVCAQALMAAARTVGEDRSPHSLHGYFLRPGQADKPVILKVQRDRDGTSFSARHVSAVQDGEVILSMLASFHVEEESGVFEPPPRDEELIPPPDELESAAGMPAGFGAYLDLRHVRLEQREGFRPPSRMWAKPRHPLPDDPAVHACVIAYLSDLGSGFGELDIEDLPKGGPTIDHTVWFQGRPRADQWLYLDQWPVKAGGSRGLYMGSIHGEDGHAVASLTQESLLRKGFDRPPPEVLAELERQMPGATAALS